MEFGIEAESPDGKTRRIYRRRFEPAINSTDRRDQRVGIEVR